MEFVKAGKDGEKKDFKFVGKMPKAEVIALSKATHRGALVMDFQFEE
ncbi:MAG: hypothetical protein Q4B68_07370 [Bacteroidales bacterium]|nr:hypothetical protein [Bacteroidales bacterium]